MRLIRAVIVTLLFSSSILAQDARINCLSMRNGCTIVQSPASFTKQHPHTSTIDNWTPHALIDDNYKTGWCSPRGVNLNRVFVFELSELYKIDELVFNNSSDKSYPGLHTKQVKVEFSKETSVAGFTTAGVFTLRQHDESSFKIEEKEARWIRLTIQNNYGNEEYTDLMEFKAMGQFVKLQTDAVTLKGVWNTNFGWVSFNENSHGFLYGCYKYNNGMLVSKGIDRRMVHLTWMEAKINENGWATLVLNEEGNALNGIWGYTKGSEKIGRWSFTLHNKNPEDCDNDNALANHVPTLNSDEARVKFKVVDRESKNPLKGVVKMIGGNGDSYLENTDDKGNCEFIIKNNEDYIISIVSDHHFSIKYDLYNEALDNEYEDSFEKTFLMDRLAVGSLVKLDNIIFEQGESELLDGSFEQLNNLVELMIVNPKMKIELGGHTDNTGTSKANLKLSEARVHSVMDYLIEQGLSKSRIKGKGYGDSKPVASNLLESTRKLNRRVEFKILKL